VWREGDESRPPPRVPDWHWRRLIATLLIAMLLLAAAVIAVMLGWISPAGLNA
jgi:hypothetical protein